MAMENVTIFGGSGFLGRHLVKRLAEKGVRIRVAVRDPDAAAFLQPMGGVGQIAAMRVDIRDLAGVRRAVRGADAVVNAVGILYPFGAQRFEAIHHEGARNIAEASHSEAVGRLVHVSSIGADAASTSRYAATKGLGEQAVAAIDAAATIVRPSVIFGPEDDFFNRFGAMVRLTPALPLPGGGHTRFQPVYVGDVAEAMVRILEDGAARGLSYDLGGPRVQTFKELMELVLEVTGRKRLLLPVPFGILKLQASFLQLLPVPPLTRDQVELLKYDNVCDEGVPGLAELGIQPTPAEAVLESYMYRYRRSGKLTPSRFA